ncbi:uncharacterized protein BBA_08998 [Beauveria bassiana ARSEF 2860]|uniref:Uncharacterized protein n=1 Tax=Beauveria bassiana (strain ARSEF 2860) TaxID=655819 RepID=J4KLE7_BEAB2|nr:uncharacterized protein BBA_08998 [Beauveria bassiana ARSEF 2860]EJP62074.1 hypothetical protein BBA_08998 [Beauveria bassiana ARSEF 2860]
MQFMKLTSGAIAVISIQAAVQPTARDPYHQELSKKITRRPGDDYTEATWTELAKKLCFDTSNCTRLDLVVL